jgi:hypothetical protein
MLHMAEITANPTASAAAKRAESRWWALVTPPTIYGTIILSGVIVAADDKDSDFEVFILTLSTIVVVWIAHVLSEVVAGEHAVTNPPTPLRAVVSLAIQHSIGLLAAAVLPLVFLLIGTFGGLTEYVAYYSALGIALVTLAVLGWLVFAHRGNAWPFRQAGAVGTALLGAAVILLKSFIH